MNPPVFIVALLVRAAGDTGHHRILGMEMKYLPLLILCSGCAHPVVYPLYDCTKNPAEKHKVFDHEIAQCSANHELASAERCAELIMAAYCKPLLEGQRDSP